MLAKSTNRSVLLKASFVTLLPESCGADFDGFLAHVIDRTVWWHVKSEWSFIHVSNEMEWVTVLYGDQ